MSHRACVIGAGPNGLAAAIVLAQAGLRVDVFEAEAQAGGAARTMELTLPGFRHDFGSAVHPLDDGTAVLLDRDFGQTADSLGGDGNTWRRLLEPFARNWSALSNEVLAP